VAEIILFIDERIRRIEMRKTISLFLVFSILLLWRGIFVQERKGADLIIQKTDGATVRGELIAFGFKP
jgi:hypothetical protein